MIANIASSAPTRPPASDPPISPSQTPPVTLATAAATNAPVSSWPSIAMLMTPDRSPSRPARAPSTSGMDAVKVPCSRSMTWSGPTELPASAQASSDSRKHSSTTAMDSRLAQRGTSTTARMMPRPIEIAPST